MNEGEEEEELRGEAEEIAVDARLGALFVPCHFALIRRTKAVPNPN